MILFELSRDENDPVYQQLAISNGVRHYHFLNSIIQSAIDSNRTFLSQHVLKALNFHAIACLHTNPGEYRPWFVQVGDFIPPEHFRVQALMDDFVNFVNRTWDSTDAIKLCAFVLWRLNHIHPFVNGNGRTARAAAYFVLCLKSGGLLPGSTILPELIRQNRPEYVAALKAVDADQANGGLDMSALEALLRRLIDEQLASAVPQPDAEP